MVKRGGKIIIRNVFVNRITSNIVSLKIMEIRRDLFGTSRATKRCGRCSSGGRWHRDMWISSRMRWGCVNWLGETLLHYDH